MSYLSGKLARSFFTLASTLRRVAIEDWLIDLRSHSYVIDLPAPERQSLLNEVSAIIRRRFSEEMMVVPYQTRVWVARRG